MSMPQPNLNLRESPVDEQTRGQILRVLYDEVDAEPPIGEHYELLLKQRIQNAIDTVGVKLPNDGRAQLEESLFNYVASYGPIQQFIDDPHINEIMVNGPNQVFIEKYGELILTDVKFDDARHVRFAINHIINPTGRDISQNRPTVDSRLPDGSRVNVVIPPVSMQGPCITIRKFLKDKLTIQQLIELGSVTPQIAEFLEICVKARLNIVVAGNTASGKTTLLNILAGNIPDHERILTIEDSAELALHQTHKVSLEAQPPNYKGEGGITIRDLVRNSLRMRPDRIIVGECRGGETIDMLQAMNTGHDGSMTTVHSNSPRDTLSRLETTALMAGIEIPILAIRKQIASAVDLIVYLNRMQDGSRKNTQVTEVVGMEGDVVTLTDIYQFHQAGVDENGKIKGTFRATGLRPMFAPKVEGAGFKFERALFMAAG
jgi:pilus assembly protein CpaF